MSNDFKSIVAQVKNAYLISDYMRNSGVKLTPAGPGKWKALCTFHNDSKPSMAVSDQFNNYHCWACGASGDIIKFVENTEHLEFFEALKKLAEEKGIEVKVANSSDSSVDYKSLRECLKESANFFVKQFRALPESHPAKQEILNRGLSLKKMLYGYAPEKRTALYDHLRSKNFSNETILHAGVATYWEESNRYSDFWSGRLMFFITDITGKPIGFAGRKLFEGDTRGKFVNSSAGPLFDKSSALFNVSNAKERAAKEKEIYVAEGQFDVASLVEAGETNVVASSGTAFTKQQGSILQRLVGEGGKVIFAFDGDEAGVKAAVKVFKSVPALHSMSFVVSFPEDTDPCDYRRDNGNEALKVALQKRVPLVSFVLDNAKSNYDMNSELGRSSYIEYAARILNTVASNSLRDTFSRKLALDTFTDFETIKELVKKAKPIELDEAPKTEEKEIVTPVLTEGNTESLVELVKTSKLYSLAFRFIALAVLDRELIQYLPKNKPKLPKEFEPFIDALVAYPEDAPLIPEAFEDSALLELMINPKLFPYSNLESFNTRDQFSYLLKAYITHKREIQKNEAQRKIASVLNAVKENHTKELEQALARENSYYEENNIA